MQTASSYLANKAVFNVKGYGAALNGVTNDAAAFQAANDAAVAAGCGTVFFPSGRALISTVVNLGNNVTLMGEGGESVLVGGIQGFLSATSKADITLTRFKIESNNHRVLFTLCTRVKVDQTAWDGLRPDGELTQQGLWSMGCSGIEILSSRFKDYNDAVYLDKSGRTVTSDILINGSTFYQENHGTLDSFPVGVYCYNVERALISQCTFRNIQYANAINGAMGYGVYEGDGESQEVHIMASTFESTGANSGRMTGALISRSITGSLSESRFNGGFRAFNGASEYLTISNNVFDHAYVTTQAVRGGPPTYKIQSFTGNTFINTIGAPLIVQNVGTPNLDNAVVEDNYFRGAMLGAIWFRFVKHGAAVGNRIVDCNTSNDSSDFFRGGINYYGCTDGLVDGNTIENTGTGSMQYGVVSGAADHTIKITANNRIQNMTIGRLLRARMTP